ncbi:hypothetical protein SeMB42_g05563 [Synchytrium endobioticum]|uniref:MYND-type domain-containing protein n=1 Tax=Synchytrium endobioticum TaxID=286115 RepID=A0A507CPV8_9FUNG|nr:hypothetical protein SeLEV6574_g06241 [Synchytrium endobioticum]TPX41466.1 hypothetical protein SeMB42_g05563 [Synchytrium endobioticum]
MALLLTQGRIADCESRPTSPERVAVESSPISDIGHKRQSLPSSPSPPLRRSKRIAAKTTLSTYSASEPSPFDDDSNPITSLYHPQGFCPAPEILMHIFSYFPQWEDTQSLQKCMCVSKQWKLLAAPFLHRYAWTRQVLARTALPQFKQTAIDWPRLCLLVLAGWKSSASGCLGAPRLFYVDVEDAVSNEDLCDSDDEGASWVDVDSVASIASEKVEQGIRKHPNPADSQWEKILACTMDFRDFIKDAANLPHSNSNTSTLASIAELESMEPVNSTHNINPYQNENPPTTPQSSDGRYAYASTPPPPLAPPVVSYAFARRRLAAGQDPARIPVLVKWSEKWDVGTYFVWADLSAGRGAVLLRCKPTDDKRVIVWDACTFGTCNKCQCRLPKIQSCAQCRIAQYCSRECQREDWFSSHKKECVSLAYNPAIPDGGSDMEL